MDLPIQLLLKLFTSSKSCFITLYWCYLLYKVYVQSLILCYNGNDSFVGNGSMQFTFVIINRVLSMCCFVTL